MHSFPKQIRKLLIPSLFLALCLTGCLPEKAEKVEIHSDTSSASISSFIDSSESVETRSDFPTSNTPFLTEDDLAEKNIGRTYTISGILTDASRASSGSILFTIQAGDFACPVYIRSGLELDAYSLTIGESYQVEGVLDEYNGTFEIIPENPEDVLHDGQYDFEEAKVVSIIDGDTVKIELANGNMEKLRIIGIDAPETEKPGQPGEYYADEATDFTTDLILNKTIYLERDNSDTDKYGRMLRYVWLEIPSKINEESISELNLSALLLKDGYAEFIQVGDDDKYAGIFSIIEQSAEEEMLGIWK